MVSYATNTLGKLSAGWRAFRGEAERKVRRSHAYERLGSKFTRTTEHGAEDDVDLAKTDAGRRGGHCVAGGNGLA